MKMQTVIFTTSEGEGIERGFVLNGSIVVDMYGREYHHDVTWVPCELDLPDDFTIKISAKQGRVTVDSEIGYPQFYRDEESHSAALRKLYGLD